MKQNFDSNKTLRNRQYLQNLKHLTKSITMTVLFGFEINRLI